MSKVRPAPYVVAIGLVFGLSACTNPYDPVQRTIGGGLIGAGGGAAIGAAAAGGHGAVRRLVLPSAEQSVRWGASLLHHRRHVTANLFPDLDDGLFRQTPGTMIQNSLAARTAERPKPAARLGFREHPGPVRERIPAVLPRGTSNAASLGSLSGAIGVPTRRGATPRASSCR